MFTAGVDSCSLNSQRTTVFSKIRNLDDQAYNK